VLQIVFTQCLCAFARVRIIFSIFAIGRVRFFDSDGNHIAFALVQRKARNGELTGLSPLIFPVFERLRKNFPCCDSVVQTVENSLHAKPRISRIFNTTAETEFTRRRVGLAT
jgi:hypothetical protein